MIAPYVLKYRRFKMESSKKIVWYNLAFMAFSTVWGFGNVLNGYMYFNGVQVIFSWGSDVRSIFRALCTYGR